MPKYRVSFPTLTSTDTFRDFEHPEEALEFATKWQEQEQAFIERHAKRAVPRLTIVEERDMVSRDSNWEK